MSPESGKTDWRMPVLSAAGVDLDTLDRRIPGIVDKINLDAAAISAGELYSLLEEAAALTGNPDLGLRLAALSDFRKMGIYGFMVLSAPDVGDMFRRAVHYHPILYRRSNYLFSVTGECATFSYKPAFAGGTWRRIDNEWTLGTLVGLVRSVTGEDWMPRHTCFTNSAPADVTALQQVFGEAILFDQPVNSFEMDIGLLELPVNQGNPQLLESVKHTADKLLEDYATTDSLQSHVSLLILKSIDTGKLSSSQVAGELGISRSTLKRRLMAIGTSFRKVRDEVISDLARKALAETATPITEIALKLGYSELSAFDRTFSRLAGMTPGRYREKASGQAQEG